MVISTIKSGEEIRQTASEWVVRMDSRPLSDAEKRELILWLEADRSHRLAFEEMSLLWGLSDGLSVLAEMIPRQELPGKTMFSTVKGIYRSWQRLVWVSLQGAAVATAMLVMALLLWRPEYMLWEKENIKNRDYVTEVGIQDLITLPDGSSIKMNTDTRLKVDYTDGTRLIKLLRGEAHFQVAHDKSRPFIVEVGSGSVTAVGTAFNIYFRESGVADVLVTDGTIEVNPHIGEHVTESIDDAPSPKVVGEKGVRVTVGEEVTFNKTIRTLQSIDPKDINRKLAWQWNMLIFDGDTLEDVIEQVTRYTTTKIVVKDPAIKEMPIGGYFRAGNTRALLNTLESGFGIEVTWVDKDLVVLTPRS